jgi:hypothetical protein
MRIKIDPEVAEAARHGIARSPEWPHVEKVHRLLQPRCTCCADGMASNAGTQVHHVFPFHYCVALGRADLELDQRNLVTLCEDEKGKPAQNHHLLVGHLDDFQSSNLDVVEDAASMFHGMTAEQIRESPEWKALVAKRLKPLSEMSEQDKQAFAQAMNQRFPKR